MDAMEVIRGKTCWFLWNVWNLTTHQDRCQLWHFRGLQICADQGSSLSEFQNHQQSFVWEVEGLKKSCKNPLNFKNTENSVFAKIAFDVIFGFNTFLRFERPPMLCSLEPFGILFLRSKFWLFTKVTFPNSPPICRNDCLHSSSTSATHQNKHLHKVKSKVHSFQTQKNRKSKKSNKFFSESFAKKKKKKIKKKKKPTKLFKKTKKKKKKKKVEKVGLFFLKF